MCRDQIFYPVGLSLSDRPSIKFKIIIVLAGDLSQGLWEERLRRDDLHQRAPLQRGRPGPDR
jgi:hypothetical protein